MTTDTYTAIGSYSFNAWCAYEYAIDNAEGFWDYAGQFVVDRETPMPWEFWVDLYEAWVLS